MMWCKFVLISVSVSTDHLYTISMVCRKYYGTQNVFTVIVVYNLMNIEALTASELIVSE